MALAATSTPPPSRPHNIQAEDALLGAMLTTPEAANTGIGAIKSPDYFFKPANQAIFSVMHGLYEQGTSIDWVTVCDVLDSQGKLESVGGRSALIKIRSESPAPSHAEDYAKIVRDLYIRRNLLSAAEEVIDLVSSHQEREVDKIIDEAEGIIYHATQERLSASTYRIADLFNDGFEKLQELYERKEAITGLATGYLEVDKLLSGLQPQNLVIVGARPSMGKTSFALGAACHISRTVPVLFFSLEMGGVEITRRILAMLSGVQHDKLRIGRLSGTDWENIGQTVGSFGDSQLFIDDNPALTIMEVRAKARRLKAELNGNLGAVFVDYLQLMTSTEKVENRQVEVSALSRGLKILARELDCPVIALSQLSRGLEARADKRPMLADLRESGSIEQDADVVMFLYRDDNYDPNSIDAGKAEVHVAKHRSGPTNTIKLAWEPSITRFFNLSNREAPPEFQASQGAGGSESEQLI